MVEVSIPDTMEDSAFKLCRFCKEQIRREAIKCRFCAEWLESSNQPRLDSPSKLTPPEETVEPASPIKSVGNALNEKYALQRPLAVEKPRAESPRGIGGWLLFLNQYMFQMSCIYILMILMSKYFELIYIIRNFNMELLF